MEVITAKNISEQLKKSISWVYRNGYDLGGSYIGGSWIFTQEGLEDAIQKGQKVGSSSILSRSKISSAHGYEKKCAKMGARKKAVIKKTDRFGLINN